MIILDATTKSIDFLLAGNVTANQLQWNSSYVDITSSSFGPLASDGTSNNTTAVTLVAAPASSTQRQVKFLSIYNSDTANAIVTVRLNSNGNFRTLFTAVLYPKESVKYVDGVGFQIMSANGAPKTQLSTDLMLSALATGFSIAGGATSKTLTVSGDATINQSVATTASPTFAGVTVSTGAFVTASTINTQRLRFFGSGDGSNDYGFGMDSSDLVLFSGAGGGTSIKTNNYNGALVARFAGSGGVRFAAYGAGTLVTDSSGNITASSDIRLKNVDGDFTRGLSDLIKISPKLYHWNAKSGLDQKNQYAGLIAQDVQAAIPEAVSANKDGILSLQDRPILAAVVNALKEVNARLLALESA